ncbi:MAG: flagellar protein FliT [Gallionellaceae bacterium]|nr:MAG: flagellar protein FliT [Gallionellaceae bacterium]
MNAAIENYEQLSSIMGEMRAAATQGDWDRLELLEKRCSQRVDSMKAQGSVPCLDEDDRRRKANLIRKILADDAEIRSHVEPWVAQLQILMQSAGQARRLQQTYFGS